MNVLFLSLSKAISDISNKGIYPDLLRKFIMEGHSVYIVCPYERRSKKVTSLTVKSNSHILGVKTLNITKSNLVEKGFGTLLLESQYKRAIQNHLSNIQFDLLIYATPPITFNRVIQYLQKKDKLVTYLLLKDIFPQNALDLKILSKYNPIYWYFKMKEIELYRISDYIGCMSKANVEYLLDKNPWLQKSKVEICPNSIEVNHGNEIFVDTDVYWRYHIPINVNVLLYGGNLGKPQGVDFLIEVLKSNSKRTDIIFIIAGSGTEYSKLKYSIENSKITNVRLLPMLPQVEYDKLLQISDIGLIFLDRRFTIPNYPSRLLSYLEYKKPVLMATDRNTDIGIIAEKNNFGMWVESGDIDSFNSKMNFMLTSKDRLKQMGESGFQYLLRNYSVDSSYNIIMSHFI